LKFLEILLDQSFLIFSVQKLEPFAFVLRNLNDVFIQLMFTGSRWRGKCSIGQRTLEVSLLKVIPDVAFLLRVCDDFLLPIDKLMNGSLHHATYEESFPILKISNKIIHAYHSISKTLND
jgi:hypothetical protein